MKTIATNSAPAAIGPYSQAKVVGNLVFTSGQLPLDAASGEFAGEDISSQAHCSIQNLEAILSSWHSSLENVIKTTCFLADMADFAAFNAVYEKYFSKKRRAPAAPWKELPKGALCEIEAIAEI